MKCVLCEEVITNPLCQCCLHEEMAQWLREEQQETIALNLTSGDHTQEGISCIRCGNLMNVCTYCCTRDALSFVKHDSKLLTQYLVYFNYDLGHLGWEQEAKAYLEG